MYVHKSYEYVDKSYEYVTKSFIQVCQQVTRVYQQVIRVYQQVIRECQQAIHTCISTTYTSISTSHTCMSISNTRTLSGTIKFPHLETAEYLCTFSSLYVYFSTARHISCFSYCTTIPLAWTAECLSTISMLVCWVGFILFV